MSALLTFATVISADNAALLNAKAAAKQSVFCIFILYISSILII